MQQQKPISRIRHLREAQKISQERVARHVGVSQVSLRDWETDEIDKVGEHIQQILLCAALKCTPEDLYTLPPSARSKTLKQIRQEMKDGSIPTEDLPLCNIAELRKKQKLTQTALAEAIGIEDKTLQNWERGRTALGKICHTILLCQVLNCKIQDLVSHILETDIERFCQKIRCTVAEISEYLPATDTNCFNVVESRVEVQGLDTIRDNIRDKILKAHVTDERKI